VPADNLVVVVVSPRLLFAALLATTGCDRVFGLPDHPGSTNADAAVAACPFAPNRYAAFEELHDWKSAELACEALDPYPDDDVYVHLAVINQSAEILQLPRALTDAWVGLLDRDATMNWQWITDEPTDPIPWDTGEPNSTSSGPKCGEVDSSHPAIGDAGCRGATDAYICECDGFPAVAARIY